MYILQHPGIEGHSGEVEACSAFLRWQGLPFETERTATCLKLTNGQPRPVLLDADHQLLAVGYFAVTAYVVDQGLVRC